MGAMSLIEDTIKERCHPSCRTCTNECLLLQQLKVGGFGLVELKQASNDWRIPFSCNACNLCAAACNRKLSAADLMRAWRSEISASQTGLPGQLALRLTDTPDNIYAQYRRLSPAEFPASNPATQTTCVETIFFPGCALSSFTPQLAQKAFDYLQQRYLGVAWVDDCCHDLLDKIGLDERYQLAAAALVNTISQTGAKRIITACPTCHYRLKKVFPELEIVSIYKILSHDRMLPGGLSERLAVHDSCPDRIPQEIGKAVRSLLPPLQKLKHEGRRSLCCGAGCGVDFSNPEQAKEAAVYRMKEVSASGAQRLVVACTNCAVLLCNTGAGIPVSHILELVFDQTQDYASISDRIAHIRVYYPDETD